MCGKGFGVRSECVDWTRTLSVVMVSCGVCGVGCRVYSGG